MKRGRWRGGGGGGDRNIFIRKRSVPGQTVHKNFLPLGHNSENGGWGLSYYNYRETSFGAAPYESFFNQGQKHIISNFNRGCLEGGICLLSPKSGHASDNNLMCI